jgi:hypothetical protein
MNHKVKIGEETYEVNLEAAIEQGLIKKINLVKRGQVFRFKSALYLLSLVDENLVCLVNLNDGNRWDDAVSVKKDSDISRKEQEELFVGENFEYVGEASNLREILNKFNSDTPCPVSRNNPDDES